MKILIFLISIIAGNVNADNIPKSIIGKYAGKDDTINPGSYLNLTVTKNGYLKISTGNNTCEGAIDGKGEYSHNYNVIKLTKKPEINNKCEISIRFDNNGYARVESTPDCSYFSGATCGFEGTLVKVKNHRNK